MKRSFLLLILFLSVNTTMLFSQDTKDVAHVDVYGFVMLDMGYNAGQIEEDWYDVVRPTKLSSYEDQYGPDGNFYASVRQTRLGVKGFTPTSMGMLKTQFEFELFGTGVDAGQTTFRLRHAYGELGKWGFGQTWSPFMDIDVFPNSVEYWGPSGMAFFRNIQARYMPIQGETRMTIALERPGASADQGPYGQVVQSLGDVRPHFALPDLSAEYRHAGTWGYVEIAGIVRNIAWEDLDTVSPDLSGSVMGYGLNLSTNLKIGTNNIIRAGVVFGAGVQNYMNDATSDVGIEMGSATTLDADQVKPLGLTGVSAFLDHKWNDRYSTCVGYSGIMIDNKDVSGDTFKQGNYALVNLMYTPVENVMTCIELQYGDRKNEESINGYDGTSITKIQFSARYNFGASIK